MKIQVLPPSLADQIAAGEVVERPASVVKELVENSLDAGAKNISVEIKRGGISFIRVTDDGYGMAPADAKTAFLRHATSKISNIDDLSNILTYGFRGEALAAICAVSKIELITCTDSKSPAYFLSLNGGVVDQEDEIGAPLGTTIIVRDLFYNTPARLHFMKKDATEAAAVTSLLQHIAIGRYDVSFTLISDQKVVFRTNKSDDMKNAIHSIYGSEISDHLMKVDFQYKDLDMKGYVCKPCVMRSNRNMQLTYLNGRFIKSKILYSGIDQAYRSSKETGKHPVCFLKFSMDPKDVDVNVHPAKLEVKFKDESQAIVLLKYGIMDALEADVPFYSPSNPNVPIYPSELFDPNGDGSWQDRLDQKVPAVRYEQETYFKPEKAILPEEAVKAADSVEAYFVEAEEKENFSADFVAPLSAGLAENKRLFDDRYLHNPYVISKNKPAIPFDMKVLGELFKVYIVIEYQDCLYLVDKHAAHEKIIYNRLIREAENNKNVAVQHLIEPLVVVLPATDIQILLENAITFYNAGFDFFESGPDRISLTAVPSILPKQSYTTTFVDILEMLGKKKTNVTDRQNQALKTIACRAAIKGGRECRPEELVPLVAKMITDSDLNYCPHGRPIIQRFTHKEIDKLFKRIK